MNQFWFSEPVPLTSTLQNSYMTHVSKVFLKHSRNYCKLKKTLDLVFTANQFLGMRYIMGSYIS